MSVHRALKSRETRGKAKKPIRFKVEMTYKQIKAAHYALEERLLRGAFANEDAKNNAGEVYNLLGECVRKFGVLVPDDERLFEIKADHRARKFLCSRCAFTSVVNLGDLCPSCLAPGAA